MSSRLLLLAVVIVFASTGATPKMQSGVAPKLAAYKTEAAASIDGMYELAQQMVDKLHEMEERGQI